MNIIHVALDLPLPRLFDYLAPDSNLSDIGLRATVPFGTGSRTGVIIGVANASAQPIAKLKTVTAILRDMPALPAEWLALCDFCSRYYQTPLGEVTSFALPPMLRRGKLPRITKAKPAAVSPSATARRASFARPPCSAVASSAPTFGETQVIRPGSGFYSRLSPQLANGIIHKRSSYPFSCLHFGLLGRWFWTGWAFALCPLLPVAKNGSCHSRRRSESGKLPLNDSANLLHPPVESKLHWSRSGVKNQFR